MISDSDINNWFTYHAPSKDQQAMYEAIREAAKKFAFLLVDVTPPSPDQTVAIRKLRECVMVANAAIACNSNE